jgi:hypothetical protein
MLILLATTALLVFAAYTAIRGAIVNAGRVVFGVAVAWVIYLAIVAGVSLATPRKVVAIGEERCFDDWCITVERVSADRPISVALRVSSQAKRVRQSAPDTSVYLEDATGKKYYARPATTEPPFGTIIGPGESYETIRQFDVLENAQIVGMVVRHGVTGPGIVIIGDDAALFHRPAIVKFE